MQILLRVLLGVLLPGMSFAAAQKREPPVTIRFHTETSATDGSAFAVAVTLSGSMRKTFISKVPALSERDLVAVWPYQARDGSWGCAFKFDDHGRLALDALSVEKRGGSLIGVVNGRQIAELLIDKRIPDGIVTIPSGLTEKEIGLLRKHFPVLGANKRR